MADVAESQTPEPIPPVPEPEQEGVVEPTNEDALATVIVEDEPLPPLGRTWAFDLKKDEFVRVGARGPRAIFGAITLLQWIDKCLHTARGALPIHPPEYGMQDPFVIFGRPIRELSVQELQRQIEDALTFHPRIAAVVNLQLTREDDRGYCTFQVQTEPPLDEDELLSIRLDVGEGIV
jgi:hypothetical protein